VKRTKGPEDIKNIVVKVIKKIERQEPGKKEKILKAWGSVVGEKVVLHSRPIGIKKGLLTIEVDSSTWLYELSLKKKSILKDIKKILQEYKIENIRFRMGDIG
jgi:predicted nucleic acid-binding Zn ribbon protein